MMSAPWFWPAAAIVFGTSCFQGLSGFGMALIAIPCLVAIVEPQFAVPIITLIAISTTLLTTVMYWRHLLPKQALWLGVPTLLASPLGTYLLKVLSTSQLKAGVGCVLVLTSGWQLAKSFLIAPPEKLTDIGVKEPGVVPIGSNPDLDAEFLSPASRIASVFIGGCSGVMGGAIGMTGPLLADYLIKTGMKRESFKVTMSVIFLASSIWRTGLYFSDGFLNESVLTCGLLFIPVALLGTYVGLHYGKRFSMERFKTFIHWTLLGFGIWFLIFQ